MAGRKASPGPASSAATIICSTSSASPSSIPNVRGSTGYGKRFVSLDNGPALAGESASSDIGAFLDRLQDDPALDRAPLRGHRRLLWRLYVLRLGDPLRRPAARRQLRRRHLQLRHLPREHPEPIAAICGASNMATSAIRRSARSCCAISPLTRVADLRIPLMVVTGAQRSARAASRRRTRWSPPSAPPAARPGT